MFHLEVIRAGEGDALVLHYGTSANPRRALIDAGPTATFKPFVEPALTSTGRGGSLAWVAISHVDADHVGGMVTLFSQIRKADTKTPAVFADVLFVNSPASALATVPASIDLPARTQTALGIQPASYQQGASIINDAIATAIAINPPAGVVLRSGDVAAPQATDPVTVKVVAPTQARIDALIAAWEAELGAGGGIVPASIDASVTNLSSLVLLCSAKEKGKLRTMLLCGDGLDTDILDGLRVAKIAQRNGAWRFDVVKLPHHGSIRNNSNPDWFRLVKARNFVISANGRYNNPDVETLDALVAANATETCTIWLSTPEGSGGPYGATMDDRYRALRAAIKRTKAKGITVRTVDDGAASLLVDATL